MVSTIGCPASRPPAAPPPSPAPGAAANPPPAASPTTASGTAAPVGSTPAGASWSDDPMRALLGRPAPSASPQVQALRGQLLPIASLRGKLKQNPDDLTTRIQLAVSLDNEGNASEAEDVLREALQRGQKKPEVYHALGMVYMKSGVYHGAIEEFQLEIKASPKSAQAYLNLAQAYVSMNQNVPALKAFEKARQLDPSLADPYMGLALLNNTSERYPIAVQYLQDYIKRTSQPGPGYALLSRVYLNMRLYDKAIEAGQKASQAMPDDPACWYDLGQAYAYHPSRKYNEEAIQAYERALQRANNWGGLHFELARVYEQVNRKPEAIARYRDAVRFQPSNGKFRYQLGRLLMQEGQAEEGQKEVKRAQEQIRLNQRETQMVAKIASFPKEPRYVYELASIYREEGEYQKSLNAFEFLVKMAPNYPKAREQWEEAKRLVLQPH